MASAIHELQKAILDPKQSLTQLLRRTKLIASKLDLQDVEQWVDLELNGYPKAIDPPKYRAFTTECLMIHNGYRGGWQYAGDFHQTIKARMPIAQIEELAKQETVSYPVKNNLPIMDDAGSSFGSDWPQRITTSGMKFKHILEGVRNELLRWATELEKRGIKGEGMNFDEKEKQLATNVNIEKFTGVFGNVTNSQVAVNDYSSIAKLLMDQNVPTKERRELEDILEELKTAPPEKKKGLIAKAEGWMVKHGETLGTGAEIIGKFIKALSGQHH
jgi:hypothetical protein